MEKNYKVRVANNTTSEECYNEDFSQTACGFVVEFVDILELRAINVTQTNIGGWPASSMRTYANREFFNKLPNDLKKVIIDTKLISGHGNISSEVNFVTSDKIYLLSPKEVWNDDLSDTIINKTRQLDYYSLKEVTIDNTSNAIKFYNKSRYNWWLRSAYSNTIISFFDINTQGYWSHNGANDSYGFSPAFRIG